MIFLQGISLWLAILFFCAALSNRRQRRKGFVLGTVLALVFLGIFLTLWK